MRIRSIHVRRFRSVSAASLAECGQLNVLIGKNNAGKSNLLATVDLMLSHLKRGTVGAPWSVERPLDEFTDRDPTTAIEIGIEFELPITINNLLRERLTKEAPHLDRAIDQLRAHNTIAFILACSFDDSLPFMFIKHLGAGRINASGKHLTVDGLKLLEVAEPVGRELSLIQDSVGALRSDLNALTHAKSASRELDYIFAPDRKERPPIRFYMDQLFGRFRVRSSTAQAVHELIRAAKGSEEFGTGVSQLIAETEDNIRNAEQRQTEGTISAFAGDTKIPPAYASWLMQQYGGISSLHLRETKRPIGRPEAEALLSLKIQRGGPERLALIQRTVRALLGVHVDAFQGAAHGERSAEMDIDEFLMEANGAGVREALRLILDLELNGPVLALIEEPEVHLHPGMEHAIESYLRQKGRESQMFITTHSTNFVDSVSFQNVYLVSRDGSNKTVCEAVDAGDAAFRIQAELGLRLSSVFMFDRLVFVEGPSDEAVLRELATILNIDTGKENVGFVRMGGVRNFAYYAAEHTLDLLARRRIRMWFIVDRDESADDEVARMVSRLGGRARLIVLERREMENYLLDAEAVDAFIVEKRKASGRVNCDVGVAEVDRAIREHAEALKDEVIRLRLEKRLLVPVHLQRRGLVGSPVERIEQAIESLKDRLGKCDEEMTRVVKEVATEWPRRALELAPGSVVLQSVAGQFGVRFDRKSGDSARLARLMKERAVSEEVRRLLSEIWGTS